MNPRIPPREYILHRRQRYYALYQEGSPLRSGIGRPSYYDLIDEHRYVLFWKSTGKIKTIQRPDFEADGYGGFVKTVRGPQ